MKPALSPQMTGLLPRVATRRLDVLEHLLLGHDRADDLDQVLHRRRVEEVDADDAAGQGVGGGDLGDAERRGVGREDALGRDDPVELAEDRLLDLERLDDRLHDQVGPGELLELGREADPAEQLGLLGLGELLALHGAVGGVLEVGAPAVDGLVVELDADDVEAVAGEDLRDSGAHGAESDHADGAEVTSHGPHPSTRLRDAGCVSGHPSTSAHDLVCAAPGEGHPGAAVAVAVDDVADPFQPHLRAQRPQPDPVADHAAVGQRRHQPGRSIEDRRGRLGRGRPVPVTLLERATHDHPVAARDDVRRTRVVEPPAVDLGPLDEQHLAARRVDVGLARQLAGAESGAVDDHRVVGLRQLGQGDPGEGAAQLVEPSAQPRAGGPACRRPAP